jgi:hypothetical protein
MKDLLLVVPSRGRPGNIKRLFDAMQATCRGDTSIIVGLDDDDPSLSDYLAATPLSYTVQTGLRQVVAWINRLAVPQAENYRYIGHVGDDNTFDTVGWDVSIMEALEKTPFAFGNDHYPRPPGQLCCHVFMRSEVVQRLGYFGPPGIRHMYVDVAWMAWGVKTGITYLHEVDIPHLHYTLTGQTDASYQASTNLIPEDLENWHRYCESGQLNTDIGQIDPGNPGFTPDELLAFNMGLNIPRHWGSWW